MTTPEIPVEPGDAILGVRPARVVEPATVAEAAEALRALAAERLAVAFVGGGTELELGAAPRRLETERRSRDRRPSPSDHQAVRGRCCA